MIRIGVAATALGVLLAMYADLNIWIRYAAIACLVVGLSITITGYEPYPQCCEHCPGRKRKPKGEPAEPAEGDVDEPELLDEPAPPANPARRAAPRDDTDLATASFTATALIARLEAERTGELPRVPAEVDTERTGEIPRIHAHRR